MKSQQISLSEYTTEKVKFYFYFPQEGTWAHFPTNISIDGKVKAFALPHQLKVVRKLTVNRNETFQDLLKLVDWKEKVLEFLQTKDLLNAEKGFSFDDMLWCLKDKAFFKQVIDILRDRFIYYSDVWQYAFYHKDDLQTMQEYLLDGNCY